MTEILLTALPLAATDDPAFLSSLLADAWLWVKVAIGIGLVIFVHELGHFAAAKLFGVKCEKFYVGFDVPLSIGPIKLPRTLGKFQYGETEYGIGILPLGGYVKMLGQDDDPRKAEQEAERIRMSTGGESAPPQLDPRSYPAKPVWQRMVIISAGVVMNVITGVLFAALAYGIGVPYTPSIVGGVTPGGPAWQAGIEPGGRVVAVGTLPEDDRLHFEDMKMAIMTEGMDKPEVPVNVSIRYGSEVRHYELKTQPLPAEPDMRLIGISSPFAAQIAADPVAEPASIAAEALSEDDAEALIVSVNGTPLELDSNVPTAALFDQIHSRPNEPLELVLQRSDGSKHSVTLPPQPAKTLGGIRFAMGPVTAVVDGGPADAAGVKVGDRVVAIDGDDDIDAYTLPLAPVTGKESVTLTLIRGEGENATETQVEVKPVPGDRTVPPVSELSDAIACNALGLAYRPLPIIAAVDPGDSAGGESPEDQRGPSALRPGDTLREVSIVLPEGELPDALPPMVAEAMSEGWEFGADRPLTSFLKALQMLPAGSEIRVLAARDETGQVVESTETVQVSQRQWYERGLVLMPVQSVHRATSLGEAMVLGLRDGRRQLNNVFRFLGMLVKGRVKAKHVGGPVRIVALAGDRAEQGIAKQLLFLTLLSMNLAILNFLPIPALDGGHMVFLAYELVRGKKVDEQLEMKLTLAGVLALLALMVFVFANDILHVL